jgi:hypothetical protein
MTAPATNNNKPREYLIGTMPRLAVTFKDPDGVAVLPTTVRFKFKRPGGGVTTWTYGSSAEITRNETTKEYAVALSADEAGTWIYRWESSGNHQSAAERKFTVTPSQLE